ncbi:MAG: hypothetical protein UZ15_CFX003002666 [Chloroflexi bacterium OLB15]|nr:MAG: hypothetical protein UZ15_CFX003002666 [Chloroflexi bacterium OLB15]
MAKGNYNTDTAVVWETRYTGFYGISDMLLQEDFEFALCASLFQ